MKNNKKIEINQFNLNNWDDKNINLFKNYLIKLKNNKKINWTQKIINTKMPVLAIKSAILRDLSKQIIKGNYKEFLDYNLHDYYEFTIINSYLISKLNNFDEIKYYLNNLSNIADNWATCDALSFKITNTNFDNFFKLSKDYLKSNLPFKRRIGIRIWFGMLNSLYQTKKVVELIPTLYSETEYYVNMILAWFVCELFIKHRNLAIDLFKSNKLNPFVTNKAIQKCRDSFRVSKEDKSMLLEFKINR